MSESENRENSVLFSLRELKNIEQSRIEEEEEARIRAEQQRVREREDRERQRREQAEAAQRAIEEEERRRMEEAERMQREELMRLQEAEMRARIEAEAALEQQRLVQEMELRRREVEKKRPTWLVAVAAGLVLLLGGGGIWGYQSYKETQEEARLAELEKRALEEQQKKYAAEIAELNRQIEEAQKQLATATSDEERRVAQKQLENLRQRAKTRKPRPGGKGKSAPKKSKTIKISDDCLKNPLGC